MKPINLFQDSFVKASVVTFLFIVVHIFYNIEIIRNAVEDVGFDFTNKFVIEEQLQYTNSPKVMVFGFDDLYMQQSDLFDKDNQANYGYLFPREHIAQFVHHLDEFLKTIPQKNMPSALFIDYDFSFTSLPYGKALSKGDEALIEILKQERPYIIFLAKNATANFIEQSEDKIIQKLITQQKIQFVSANFLKSSDDIFHRYSEYELYKEKKKDEIESRYPNVNTAVWKLTTTKTKIFQEKDIIANRIFLKTYQTENIDKTKSCKISPSYWTEYNMYSASCPLNEIKEKDFSNAIIMLGATHSHGTDKFDVFDYIDSTSINGVELHANTLMTIFHLNGQLARLCLPFSSLLIFFIFLITDVLLKLFIQHKKLRAMMVFFILSVLLFFLSRHLLVKGIWLNWFIPSALFGFYYMILFISMKINKFKKEK